MNYQSYHPKADLSAFVKCYWTMEAPKALSYDKQRIVPDGCMEMIFHYGDKYRQYEDADSFIVQPNCFVFGQITRPLDIQPTGETNIFSVRFHPEGFSPFSDLPIAAMENRAVPLAELFAEEGLDLEKEMLQQTSIEGRIHVVESFLLKRLGTKEAVDRTVKSSVAVILELNGQLSVEALSEQLQINRRQLERKFSSAIGLSPKQLSKIIRLQGTLKMLANQQFSNLTSIAYDGDYYDQAHFIKDFKEFTGVSPKKFYANNLKMSSLFIDTE